MLETFPISGPLYPDEPLFLSYGNIEGDGTGNGTIGTYTRLFSGKPTGDGYIGGSTMTDRLIHFQDPLEALSHIS